MQPTCRDGLVQRVLLQLQVVSDLGRVCAGIQPPLDFLEHGRLEDGRTTRFSLGIEARHAVRAITFDRTFDADAGDPEGPYDLGLLRIARDTELGGDHPKGGAVLFR